MYKRNGFFAAQEHQKTHPTTGFKIGGRHSASTSLPQPNYGDITEIATGTVVQSSKKVLEGLASYISNIPKMPTLTTPEKQAQAKESSEIGKEFVDKVIHVAQTRPQQYKQEQQEQQQEAASPTKRPSPGG